MGKLLNGVLVGFGFALSIVVFASWHFLVFSISQGFLVVGEADFMQAVEVAANLMTAVGVLLTVAGIGVELYQRHKQTNKVEHEYPP